MRSHPFFWNEQKGWSGTNGGSGAADLVLYFGTRQALASGARYRELRERFPRARIAGCSTGGQIRADDVSDSEVAAIALEFKATEVRIASEPAPSSSRSRDCGAAIGQALAAPDLAGVFVLSDGLHVNGSELVEGLAGAVGRTIPVTGGLAGDGPEFGETLVGADCAPQSKLVAAVGFYGTAIRFGHGSEGGWSQFGPRRRITRSEGNVLFELDGKPALDLYERYLGEAEAQGLPGTALLFPLRIFDPRWPQHDLVRTILAVDREARSMTFAGDMPCDWSAQLMRGNLDRLAAGAAEAARQARVGIGEFDDEDGVAILVSCIGRRLLMGQRTTDEIEAAADELGPRMARIGFYSYGEISPHNVSGMCELHNQTMTVTTIAEATG
jgi:hypothetical protein